MDTLNITTLDKVVNKVMLDLKQTSKYDYNRYMQWAIDKIKEMNIFYVMSSNTVYLPVTSINTVNLPNDYISYQRVGLVVGGEIYTLSKNNDLLMPGTDSCGEEESYDDLKLDQSPVTSFWRNAPAKVFNIGFYKEDKKNNRLIMKGNFHNSLIAVEYSSTGINMDGETYIPEEASNTVVSWIHLERTVNGERGEYTEADINRRERRYNAFFNQYISFQDAFTYDELLDTINSGRSSTPK